MSVFNKECQGHKDGYPLFLGPDLGVVDTINIQYPQLEELYQLQLSQIWNEFEVDLTQDKMDMLIVKPETTDLMVKTIMWQTCADSVASRSIIEALGPFISNSELYNLGTLWSFFEVIHARTYSHIIKQTFNDSNQMLEELYADVDVANRMGVISDTFDRMHEIARDADSYSKLEVQCTLLNTVTALFALEAIAFMSSFAVTFAITETGVFNGIGQLVKLICRDEVLHTRMDYAILDILVKDPEWEQALSLTAPSRKAILDSVVDQEIEWADNLFQDGRKVVGLNAGLLKEYVSYMARPLYDAMGLTFGYGTVTTNPLPYMDSYIDSTAVQAAPQEIQLVNYNVGAIADDNIDDLDLDDLDL